MRKKVQEKKEKNTIKERMADAVDISKEILLDVILISCIGNKELTLENYKGILEYSNSIIRVKAKPDILKITGRNLEIKNITQELLYITGTIESLSFEK